MWSLDGSPLGPLQNIPNDRLEVCGTFVDEDYFCFARDGDGIAIFSTKTGELIRKWAVPNSRGIAMSGDLVFVAREARLTVYCLHREEKVREWDLEQRSFARRNLVIDNNEIFLADHGSNKIQVFSVEGTLLREWNATTNSVLWSIVVYQNLVYATCGTRVAAFTRDGKYLWQSLPKHQDLGGIFISNNFLYLTDWGAKCIIKCELLYG